MINEITFGGSGGNFEPVFDTGGKTIIFRSGTIVDSIQIGGTRHGGGGGTVQLEATIPEDETFMLQEIQTARFDGHTVISYISAVIGGMVISAGERDGENETTLNLKLPIMVKFIGISSGVFVDLVRFGFIEEQQ